jgi:hypothetical protein
MPTLIEAEVFEKLSRYELSLLLCAAYLHDIGMTPAQGLVQAVFDYVFAGSPDRLEATTNGGTERDALELWVTERHAQVELPLNRDGGTPHGLALARTMVAHYARFRHNEWSSQWIAQHFDDVTLDEYPQFPADLNLLCRSHHYAYSDLAGGAFTPRVIGGATEVVHLRFLAAMLRIADVLDVDPERTPSVVFRRRDVSPASALFWYKDHELSVFIRDSQVVLHARPTEARVHRAVEQTAEDIDRELALCRRLDEQTHFNRAPWMLDPLPHRWSLSTVAVRDISAREGTYEYINGAFRIDTDRILDLLGGTALYSSRFAAVRELIQNSLDAVREQIAWQQLDSRDPLDQELRSSLARMHTIDLRFEPGNDGDRLLCSDSGVGMTGAIIEDGLLVSGQGRRREVLELEHRCADAGIALERTGRFGIGVLSYFMLASRVSITTRRSPESGGSDPTGWRFEVDGVDGFGELRRDSTLRRGTEVRLHLHTDLTGDPVEFYDALQAYVASMLAYLPCKFRLSTTLPGRPPLVVGPGWTTSESSIRKALAGQLTGPRAASSADDTPPELLTAEARAAKQRSSEELEATRARVEEAMRFEVVEDDLPAGMGRYRLHVPWFELGGLALSFLQIGTESQGCVQRIGAGYLFRPRAVERPSWRGMSVRSGPGGHIRAAHHAFIEIDWTSSAAGSVHVSRETFDLSTEASVVANDIWQASVRLRRRLAGDNLASPFATLNLSETDAPFDSPPTWRWLSLSPAERDSAPTVPWKPIAFPAANARDLPYSLKDNLVLAGVPVTVLPDMVEVDGSSHGRWTWEPASAQPDRLVAFRRFSSHPLAVPVWTTAPAETAHRREFLSAPFPSAWTHVLGARCGSRAGAGGLDYWNSGSPIVAAVRDEDWRWTGDVFRRTTSNGPTLALDPRPHMDAIAADAGKAAAWLMRCLAMGARQLFTGVAQAYPDFVQEIWRRLGAEDAELVFLNPGDLSAVVFRRGEWHVQRALSLAPDRGLELPEVDDPEWFIVALPAEGESSELANAPEG